MTKLRIVAWVAWIAIAALAAVGLLRLRIDNQLENWAPQLQSLGPYPSYLVIGWERGQADAFQVGLCLRNVPEVGLCVDSTLVATGLVNTDPGDFVTSRDGQYLGAFCFRTADVSDQRLVDAVTAGLADRFPGVRFAVAGPAVYHVAMDHYSQNRLLLILCVITVVGFLALWNVTRDLQAAAVTVVALGLSQAVLLGGVGWAGRPLDLSAAMAPPLMMSLGFSYAAHRMLGIRKTGVLALCALTTIIGIGTFAFGDSSPLRTFAVLGMLGLAIVWLAVMTLLRPMPRRRRPRRVWLRPVLAAVIHIATRHPVLVRVVALAVVVGGLFALPRLQYALDPLAYFPIGSRERADFETLDRRLTGMLPFQVVVRPAVDAAGMLSTSPGVRKVIDISWTLRNGDRTYWCLASNSSLPQLLQSQADWQHWAAARGVSLQWRGVAAQVGQAHVNARRDALAALPLMLLLAGLATVLVTRRLISIAAGAWVCAVPVLAMAGLAALFRQPLDLPALMIGGITVGVAVDDTLHLVTAYRRRRNLRRTVIEQWRACAGSSLIAICTMLCFALSPFAPTRQFGILTAGALLLAAVANHVLLAGLLPGLAGRAGEAPRRRKSQVLFRT